MIICFFTGFSCSGKSTVISELSSNLNYNIINIHSLFEIIKENYGYSKVRDFVTFNRLDELMNESIILLTKMISRDRDNNIHIVDGTYSIEVVNKICSYFSPDKSFIVTVFAEKEQRISRMQKRKGFSKIDAVKELEFIDHVKINFGIDKVINNGNIFIDTTNTSLDKNILKILQQIKA